MPNEIPSAIDLANTTDWDAHGEEVDSERNDVLRSREMSATWARRFELLGDVSTAVGRDELAGARPACRDPPALLGDRHEG